MDAAKSARRVTAAILALLVIEFYLGMFENLFVSIPSNALPPNSGVGAALIYSLLKGGPVLALHVIAAFLLVLASFVLMILMFRQKLWNKVLGILGFVFILVAAISGILFVLSNSSISLISYTMAGAFMAALALYAILIYRIGRK
jgi:heme A synthase